MENEYKFVSKFIEGKTYKELTAEEIEKLKSGVGVKKEDKEYIDSMEKSTIEINETNNETMNDNVQELGNEELEKNEEKIEEPKKDDVVKDTPTENIDKSKKGVEVVRAFGKVLILADKRVIELTKEELKEKTFWRKGDVYYG